MTSDDLHRRRAVEETGKSFAVEASAGTGKTSTLIDRILHLVLFGGPRGKPLEVSQIAAITFTEKAAGEMKIRLRQRLEEQAIRQDDIGERAREALRELGAASVSTFHAFAVSMLKERPIEAGLDPRFTALDEMQSELFFMEVWDAWLRAAIDERRGPIERALRRGMRLETLRNLAAELRRHSHAVRELDLPAPPSEEDVRQQRRAFRDQAQAYLGQSLNQKDRLVERLGEAISWLEAPESATVAPRRSGNVGSGRKWAGGETTVAEVRALLERVTAFRESYEALPVQRLLDDVARWLMSEFLPEWERAKRLRGFLDFDDQLAAARDLLRKSRAARQEFQRRYATILVDEFQDTDTVQLDIVLLLSSTDLDESDPDCVRLDPGRLFIVGDPKQSIYRFRGADIETYLSTVDPGAMKSLELVRLELTKNFRSVPSILRFVDEAFSGQMKKSEDGHYQPDYLPFAGPGARARELDSPAVRILAETNLEGEIVGSGQDFFDVEARRTAKMIRRMHRSEEWKVQERAESPAGTEATWRPPEYGDIAVLLPVLTRADAVEEALTEAGIPYVVEGGKFYYARSEVASAITVLRAISNPNDAVALYGALRSIFFGLSDQDLLKAHAAGLPMDFRCDVAETSVLSRPYKILRDLYMHRHERLPSETFETLLRCTGAREVLAARGFQSVANLGKLARTIRSLQPGATFSQVVELLRSMDEEGIAERESRLVEERSDAVRVMSIHKAKGLDFPIVFVAGLGIQRRNRASDFLADPHQRKIFGLSVGTRGETVRTPGWEDLVEHDRNREDAELVRLLYVAMTRARDHLILCAHTKGKNVARTDEWEANFDKTRLEPLKRFLSSGIWKEKSLARIVDARAIDSWPVPSRAPGGSFDMDWKSALEEEYAELHGIVCETPHAAAHRIAAREVAEEEAEAKHVPDLAQGRAIRLGVAFHEAMEGANLGDPGKMSEWAAEAGQRQMLDGRGIRLLEEMMRKTFDSALVKRAVTAQVSGRNLWRELPYIMPLSDIKGVEEGKIDLLFEEEGGWVVVDYKTDRIDPGCEDVPGFFRDKYSGQMLQYVAALDALRVKVKAAYLLLARTGAHVEIPLHHFS